MTARPIPMNEMRGAAEPDRAPRGAPVPRLGFLGVGWIGRQRMATLAASGAGRVSAIVDPSPDHLAAALREAPGARALDSLDALLSTDLDGIVIATPSALHAGQAEMALARGKAVFCQKPLARTAAETRRVIDAARAADRLLAVDLSYRHTAAMRHVSAGVRAGEIGRVFAAELVFHNAYGPDQTWCHDPALAGGGCLMDLGVHLVDMLFSTLEGARVAHVAARLIAGGEPLTDRDRQVEDYAEAQLTLEGGAVARLACSWRLPLGRGAEIGATFYGTRGALAFRNVGGSFYDFAAERYDTAARRLLVEPPDEWGGRALVEWSRRLAAGERFDPAVDELVDVAAALDAVYSAGIRPCR
ncbi:MAG TPA: Gfo/Idh/MocA family oxidoreductase [Gemmatimonadales bacterium]|nr:Gfo/Idh/MocA family oxidoreductase [Gemmatimonadales bacterium]